MTVPTSEIPHGPETRVTEPAESVPRKTIGQLTIESLTEQLRSGTARDETTLLRTIGYLSKQEALLAVVHAPGSQYVEVRDAWGQFSALGEERPDLAEMAQRARRQVVQALLADTDHSN